MEFLFFMFVAILFYFLPTCIAEDRDAKNVDAIFLVNFFLGWTILGWIAGVIWAIVDEPEPTRRVTKESAPSQMMLDEWRTARAAKK